MDERVRLAELVELSRGVSTIELRDALRREGRSSITSADIERMLASSVSQRSGPSAVATATATPSTVPTAPTLPTPYPWQQSALDAWHHAGDRGVIEAVTGAGKTMIGLLAAGEEIARRGQVAVIVPTRELLAQWVALLRPILPPGVTLGLLGDGSRQGLDCHDVVVAVVNSARDLNVYPRRPGGLLIADECHRYGSACNSLVLHDRFPRRLGLSATFARSDDAHETLLKPYLGGVCFRLGYTEARIAGVIAAFDVTLI